MFKFFFVFLFPLALQAQTANNEHELLWEITGNGLKKPSYLFGSFHSNDKRLFDLSDSTFIALRNAEMVVLETDIFSLFDEWDTRTTMLDIEYDNQGQPYVASPYATETIYGDEDGMPQFLDAFFEQYCWNSGKKFAALESVDFQLNLLNALEEADYSSLRWGALLTDQEDLLATYFKGNIYELDDLLRASLSIYPNGYTKIITERNVDMASGLDSLLRSGNRLFSAVGAGHLAGAEGVINLLRRKGYRMRKVLATYAEEPTVDRKEVFAAKSYTYINDSLKVRAILPGKPKLILGDFAGYDLKLVYRDYGQGNTYEIEIYPRIEEIGLAELSEIYIASPSESPVKKIELEGGGEARQGLADAYPEGLYWARVIMNEESFIVIKAYGGNKFMNSNRPQRFFDQVFLY